MIFVLTLFTLLLVHIGRHTKSNIYLAIYFISQLVGISSFFFGPTKNLLLIICQSICFAWGALFYLFISSLFLPGYKFKVIHVLHFLPVIFAFILLLGQTDIIFKSHYLYDHKWIFLNRGFILNTLFSSLIIGYNIAIIYKYYLFYKKGNNLNASTIWIRVSVFGFTISCFIVQFGKIHIFQTLNWVNIGNIAFLIYFSILLYVAIVNRTITDKLGTIEKYKKSSLNNNISNEILVLIETYMQNEKPYLDPEFCLRNLSDTLKIQEKYISEVINRLRNLNFSEFVNSYRISYAMELLRKPENKNKTMLFILFESGFNSKTTFNNCFKKIVSCTPLEYKNGHK